MPMFRSEDQYPDWCELEHFEVVRLNAGDEHSFARRGEVGPNPRPNGWV